MYRFTLFIIILLVFISCSSNIFFWDGRDPAFENDSKYVGLWSDSGKNLVCLILIPHDVGYAFTSDFKSKLEMDLNTSISSFQITLLGVNEKPNKIYFTKKGLFFNDEQIKTDSLTRVFVLTKNSNLIPINLTYQELNYFQFDSLEYLDNKYIWTEKIKNQLEKDEFKFQMTAKIRNTLEGITDHGIIECPDLKKVNDFYLKFYTEPK